MLGLRARVRRLRYGIDHGRMVRERGRFALNETLNRDKIASYRLAEGGSPISLRHHASTDGTPSVDTWILFEIFRDRCYVPPPQIETMLRDVRGGPTIVDVGANIGLFTAFVLDRYPQARVTAFEPDPDSLRLLRDGVLSRPDASRCELHEACALTRDATVSFAQGNYQFSHLADGSEDGSMELPGVDIFPFWRDADLAKIDIEGGEWELLADERMNHSGPRSITMEYHPRFCPDDDPKAFAERLLREHGYEIVEANSRTREPIIWAIKHAPG